ncbi:MAG: 23S rRNA (uracil(1939)-C(5))-methyltransferase RlmD [Geminocystis sp.]|nr:23S rRNA (uracil(1939)-C(5))-methyltransferase RlmD [Geminocystis sp.]MCX8078379.1 23S rRNA (uracil(1939)-C(5))-methyltransferase RlmD [Geminocystis sp.]MDW8463556.1 23S rRNA (uracil(1939)-C(5))-methyltransferase RlmD [Geminocystis sp.]
MVRQGDIISVTIEDVSSEGYGVGRINQQVVFIPDTVTGDRVKSRIVRVKRKYAEGKIKEIESESPHRTRPSCIVADKCGGCQWQHIDYQYQLQLKENQVRETLTRIGGFTDIRVEKIIAGKPLGYRNKVSYPLAMSAMGRLKAGYYRRGSHQVVNINKCPIQDERLNPLLAGIKKDLQASQIPVYDEKTRKGALRHLCFRIGKNTGEILVTLVTAKRVGEKLKTMAQKWMEVYPEIVGVTLNYNPKATNVIFGEETELLAGRGYLRETFAGLTFHLRPETFFQVNTNSAEDLLFAIFSRLDLKGNETVLDLYCGIGTFTLPFAQKVKKVIGIESHYQSIIQAEENAILNGIDNVQFITGEVEAILPTLAVKPEVVVLDPPRKGCEETVMETLRQMQPETIVYISCHPATLARDLRRLGEDYNIKWVQPADFFPQTCHVETAVIVTRGK